MNWDVMMTIAWKDLWLALKQPMVLWPLILLPVILLVGMPAFMAGTFMSIPPEEFTQDADMDAFFNNMPESMLADLRVIESPREQMVYLFLVYIFAPMFLVLPLMVSSVIGSDSFAGEKERKTMEALLYTPTTDVELFGGKLLAAWIPAVVVAVVGAGLYWAAINVVTTVMGGFQMWPNAMWGVMVFWLAPAAALLGIAGTVLVSSRVSTTQESYQASGMLVLPVVGFMIAQVSGLLYLNAVIVLMLGLVVWVIAGVLLFIGIGTFQRSELIAKL